ncbi:MAG: ABC transporter substrate-binding protein [Bacillota bacterium]
MKFKLQNKRVKCIASLLAFTMALSACGSSSTGNNRTDPNMELNIATTALSLETGVLSVPWRQLSFISSVMYRHLFLATVGESEIACDLAKDYNISEDGLVYEITLKDDVVWSDGEPLTIDDVVFSLESLLLLSKVETVNNILLTSFSEIVGAEEFMNHTESTLEGLWNGLHLFGL